MTDPPPPGGVDKAGGVDNPEHPDSGSAGGAPADAVGGAPAGPGPEPLVERGRGRRRLALVVPVVAVVCGLVAGGVAGERVVTRRAATVAGAGAG